MSKQTSELPYNVQNNILASIPPECCEIIQIRGDQLSWISVIIINEIPYFHTVKARQVYVSLKSAFIYPRGCLLLLGT